MQKEEKNRTIFSYVNNFIDIPFISKYGELLYLALIWILFGAIIIYTSLSFLVPIEDYDFWWHLRSGQHIVENMSLPVIDPFTFPRPQSQTMREEFLLSSYWLAQVAYYLVYATAGFKGLIFFRALILSLMFATVFVRMKRLKVDTKLSIVFLSASIFIFGDLFYGERPQVFSFLGIALLLGMFEKIRDGDKPSFLLFPMMIIWSNLHGGSAIGDCFLALFAAGYALQYRLNLRQCLPVVFWSMGGIIASFANPNGYNAILLSTQLSRESLMTHFVDEYQSSFELFSAGHFSVVLLWGMVLLWIIGMVVSQKLYWPDILVGVFASYISIAYMRNIAFFAVALAPFTAYYIHYAIKQCEMTKVVSLLNCFFAVLMVGMISYSLPNFIKRGSPLQQVEGENLPIHLADFIEHAGIKGRVFNEYDWGGYLIWRLYPQSQTFIDGAVIDPSIISDYKDIFWGKIDTQSGMMVYNQLLHTYKVDYVVLRLHTYQGTLVPLLLHLMNDPEWIPTYVGKQAIVIVKNNSLNAGPLREFGIDKNIFINKLLINFDGLIKHNPENYKYYLVKAEMLIFLGKAPEAEILLLEAKKLSPDNYFINTLLSRVKP